MRKTEWYERVCAAARHGKGTGLAAIVVWKISGMIGSAVTAGILYRFIMEKKWRMYEQQEQKKRRV